MMLDRARRSGVAFRPHVKTHKTIEGARIQTGGSGAITVSTMAEAEAFARAGFDDILYAVPIAPHRLPRAAALARTIRRMIVLVDHPDALQACEEFARAHDLRIEAALKVDSGARRAGVDPASGSSIDLARRLGSSDRVLFAGLVTHAGHSYACRSREEILPIAIEEAAVLTRFRDTIGMPALSRSIGSTPTASVVDLFPDTDEVRPGNYVFFDAFQASIGSCSLDDCAASVIVSVIGHYPASNRIIVDGGALALSKDTGPTHIDPAFGYGRVCALAGDPLPLRIVSLSQEHGQIVGDGPLDFAGHPIGSRLRIVPNHSCLTAALYDRYWVMRGGRIEEEWRPVRGW